MEEPYMSQTNDPLPLVYSSVQNQITKRKERLREIRFNAVLLMMNIMIDRIIAEQELKWVPWEIPSTMIIN